MRRFGRTKRRDRLSGCRLVHYAQGNDVIPLIFPLPSFPHTHTHSTRNKKPETTGIKFKKHARATTESALPLLINLKRPFWLNLYPSTSSLTHPSTHSPTHPLTHSLSPTMVSDRIIRISHVVLFTLIFFASIISLGISASLVKHYNDNGYPEDHHTAYKDRIRILLVASVWTVFFSSGYLFPQPFS